MAENVKIQTPTSFQKVLIIFLGCIIIISLIMIILHSTGFNIIGIEFWYDTIKIIIPAMCSYLVGANMSTKI